MLGSTGILCVEKVDLPAPIFGLGLLVFGRSVGMNMGQPVLAGKTEQEKLRKLMEEVDSQIKVRCRFDQQRVRESD